MIKEMRLINSIALLLLLHVSLQAQNIEQARALTAGEQYDAAGMLFRQLLKSPGSQSANVWFYYGENLFKAEETDSARWAFEQGLQADANNPLNHIGLAKINKIKGNAAQAEQHLAKGLELGNNKNPEALIRAAEVHIFYPKRDMQRAFTLLQQAEKLQPKNPEIQILNGDAFLENNDGSNAIKFYEKAYQIDPKSPTALLRLGQLWVRARYYMGKDGQKGALEYFKEAVAVSPNFAPAYRELAELYGKAQYYGEAKENYRKYLELSNRNPAAKARYAYFLFITKEYEEAFNLSNEVLQADSSKNFVFRIAGYSSFELKDYEKALFLMNRFFAKAPADKVLASDFAYMGKIYAALGKDSLASDELSKALAMDSLNLDIINDAATIYAKLKQYDRAVNSYRKKIALGKAGVNDYFKLGQAYYNLKEFTLADTAFMYVTEKQPNLPVGHIWRARANASLDPETDLAIARPHYERFIELAEADRAKNAKDLMEAYKYLGFMFYKQKDFASAKPAWEKVLEIDAADKQALEAIADIKKKLKG